LYIQATTRAWTATSIKRGAICFQQEDIVIIALGILLILHEFHSTIGLYH
jgi:hypothetical protein